MVVLWVYYETGSTSMLENWNFDTDPAKGEGKSSNDSFYKVLIFKHVSDTKLKETMMGNLEGGMLQK